MQYYEDDSYRFMSRTYRETSYSVEYGNKKHCERRLKEQQYYEPWCGSGYVYDDDEIKEVLDFFNVQNYGGQLNYRSSAKDPSKGMRRTAERSELAKSIRDWEYDFNRTIDLRIKGLSRGYW